MLVKIPTTLALLCLLALTTCSTQRTDALERRQIRSDNMNQRVQNTFDAM